jgi:hypothetical protein
MDDYPRKNVFIARGKSYLAAAKCVLVENEVC